MKYLLIAIIFLAACGNPATKEKEPVAKAVAKTTAVKLNNKMLHAVYEHYVLLTAALVKGDVAAAKIAGNAIETGAREIAGAESISKAATAIIAAPHLEAQRTAYASLSNDFIAMVRQTGISSGTLHVDHCPMALNDQGAYWISADKAIRNPYFGEQMMTCGEVKETIQ